jgi:hypothetical protein
VHDSYFDDFMIEPWEEPDEAGYSEEEARRDLVEKEIRRRIKKESKKKRRERLRVGALARGILLHNITKCRMGFHTDKIRRRAE